MFQMSDEKRRLAQKQARPFGLREKWPPLSLQDLIREYHYRRPAPNRGPFLAATRFAMKREQTLTPDFADSSFSD